MKTGVGALALAGSNDYSGGTTLSQGTLSFATGGLGSTGAVTLAAGTVLEWAAGNTQDVSSRLVLPGSGDVTLDIGSNDVTLGAGFGAGSSGGVTKAGAGTLTLTGSSGYTGLTTVSTGTLALTGSGALASAVDLPASGNTLDISGASGNRTIGGLSGAAGSQVLLGGNTLTAAGIGPSSTFDGVISGAGGFTLAADGGLFAFSSQQAFTGPARVEAGTLEILTDDTLESASSIVVGLAPGSAASIDALNAGLRVFDAQTLGGYGTVRGDVTFLGGSILSPGGSVGTLANYAWLIADAGSEISTFDATWFRVNTGNFLNLPGEPGRFSVVRGDNLAAGFGSGTNEQLYVVYAAIPEPGTLLLAGLGLAGLGLAARRRRTARATG